MSDAIQVSNVDKLEPEMQNVFHMFARAANAIVRASDLGREVSKLTSEVSTLTEAYSNVDGLRQSHEARIDTFIADLSNARQQIANQADSLRERSGEIDRLKADNSQLRRVLEMTTRQYDEVCSERDHFHSNLDQTLTQYEQAEAKLKKFREILGLPEPHVAVDLAQPGAEQTVIAQVTESPGDTHVDADNESTPKIEPPFLKPEGQESRSHGSADSVIIDEVGTISEETWNSTQPKEGGPNVSVGKYEHDTGQVGSTDF